MHYSGNCFVEFSTMKKNLVFKILFSLSLLSKFMKKARQKKTLTLTGEMQTKNSLF